MSPADRRAIPVAMRDAVEMWARQNRGTHGYVAWNPVLKCAVIDLELRADDPRMKAWQEGRLKHKPMESIPLHYQAFGGGPFIAIDIEQLGVSGLLDMLDKANTWSGRGQYNNMIEAVQAAERQNENLRESVRKAALDNTRDRTRDMRRQILDLPLVSVPANIGASTDGT